MFVTSRSSVETAERIELFFCMEAFSDLSYSVLQENSDIYKNKGTSLWDCVPNSGLRKFRHSISIVETCYQLSSRKVDAQSVINWTVVGQLSWQYLPATLDHCSLSQRLSCSVYSTIPSRGLISDRRYEYLRYQNWCKPRASKQASK